MKEDKVTEIEFGILACLVCLVLVSFLLVYIQSVKDVLLELLVIVLIGVNLVSLAFQVRNHEEKHE